MQTNIARASGRSALAAAGLALVFIGSFELPARAQAEERTMTWKGRTWRITNGGMVGVCEGDPANVSIDSDGYLHMRITNAGGVWTAAEIFTMVPLGFGAYQWQIDAPIDVLDPNVVVGLFPYGPARDAPSTNEIDIEYARWGLAKGANADWVVYPASGMMKGSLSYSFSLNGGTLSTSRMIWSSTNVSACLMNGLEPPDSINGLLKSWLYTPANPTVNIPQTTLRLGMNFWCYRAPPGNGQDVEIVVRDFQFLPEATSIDPGLTGGGGAGGAGGDGNGSTDPDGGGADEEGGASPEDSGGSTGGTGGGSNAGGASGDSEPPVGGGAMTGGTSISGGTSPRVIPTCGTVEPQQAKNVNDAGCGCKLMTRTKTTSAVSIAGLLSVLLVIGRGYRTARRGGSWASHPGR